MLENVKGIIKAYCAIHYPDADGLSNFDCGCSFDDLQPCDSFCMECVPSKWDQEDEVFTALKIKSSNIRFSETGSSPYYLNTNTTTKEVPNQDNTDPKNGLLEASLKNRIVIDSSIIKSPTIMNNTVIIGEIKQGE